MKPIRLGVIGLGLIWLREHLPSLKAIPEAFTPTVLADVSAERREQAARDYPNAQVVADYHDVINSPNVDAVLVLTPIHLNAPVAMEALAAGKDVIMEKPIARSVAEGRELIAAARKAGKRLYVTEQAAYRNAAAILGDVVRSGEIGDLILWNRIQHLEADTASGPMSYASTNWRKEANFPLGTLFDGGIHVIANLTKTFGAPVAVSATGRKWRPQYGEYDQVAMTFRYADQLTGILSHSNCLPAVENHYHIHGTQGVVVVHGDKLVIEKPGQEPTTMTFPDEYDRSNMWQAFSTAFQGGEEPFYSAERALQDVAILEAVDRAIKSGRWETIEVTV
jgi:predicted dehydrogenase